MSQLHSGDHEAEHGDDHPGDRPPVRRPLRARRRHRRGESLRFGIPTSRLREDRLLHEAEATGGDPRRI
ncbi:hypothetical protein OHB56_02025 [Streptomyces sp. NBC_01635]|nr:hypothetical protein OHB56_02025 [Streptomyces sp. NBC_01635]